MLLSSSVRLFLAICTCFRLAQLAAYDDGPMRLLLKVRTRLGCYVYGENGRPRTSLAQFLTCPFCLGVWLAIPCAALFLWPTLAGDLFLLWWGIAGGAAFMEVSNVKR